ncbi:MAG: sigma-70 domain-containing protein [Maioricimonas sp. JB049]
MFEQGQDEQEERLSDEEMARRLELPISAVRRIRNWKAPTSTQRRVGDDDGAELGDLLEDENAPAIQVDPADRDLLIHALCALDDAKMDPLSFYVTACTLGLHGDEVESLVSIRRALGRTNPESLRLRGRRTQAAMVEIVRQNPEKFGLVHSDISDIEDDEWVTSQTQGDPIVREVEQLRQTAEGSSGSTGGSTVDDYDWDVITDLVRAAYEAHELEMLTGAKIGLTDRPGARNVCGLCGTLNPPRAMADHGCYNCGWGKYIDPGETRQGELALYAQTKAEPDLQLLSRSGAYREALRRRRRIRASVQVKKRQPQNDTEAAAQIRFPV